MSDARSLNLSSTYLRLRNNATVEPLPVDETFWPSLMEGKLGTFHHEYLVTSYIYDADWPAWEMHPNGDEIVCLISGDVEFILEIDGKHKTVGLNETASYVIVPQGTWHTAKVKARSHMLFITAGEGTQHREVNS